MSEIPSTASLTQQHILPTAAGAASVLGNTIIDPSDYIEISQPDSIFLNQWNCVPIRCTLAAEDRKGYEGSSSSSVPNLKMGGGSSGALSGGSGGSGSSSSMRPPPSFIHSGANNSNNNNNASAYAYTCDYIVPRQSFLFMHCTTILEGFKNVVAKEGFPWFSYRVDETTTVALPWQYPVAVVIDMMRMKRRLLTSQRGGMGGGGGYMNCQFEDRVYPFEITLHLSEPKVTSASDPSYIAYLKTLRVKDLKGGLLFIRQLLKRSTVYAFGSTVPILELESRHPDYYTDLFEGIQENDPIKFWRGRCGLRYYGELEREDEAIEASIVNISNATAIGGVGGLPSNSNNTNSANGGMGSPQATTLMVPIDAAANTHAQTTAATAKSEVVGGNANNGMIVGVGGGTTTAAFVRQQLQAFPVLLHCEGTTKLIRWRQNGQKLGQFLKEHVPWLEFLTRDDIFHRHEPAHFILVQGVSPYLSSPMEDLYELLASTDLFLHIVVRPAFVPISEVSAQRK